jgi:phosphopantothenoylcysteine decarboxylase/phosphopantothenate--cysteine ligase
MKVIHVGDTDELANSLQIGCDVLIMAAAVSDYKLKKPFAGKLKRSEVPSLELVPTQDLIAAFAARNKGTYCVAFALTDQSSDVEAIAKQKLKDKGVQMVVGNTTRTLGGSDAEVVVVEPESIQWLSGTKSEVATAIVGLVAKSVANS